MVPVRSVARACAPVCVALASVLFIAARAESAEIFASTDAQGVTRYATQRLDDSYVPLLREATAPTPARALAATIERIAGRHGVPTELVAAIVHVESGANPRALSPKGARGAMQLMPQTARRYGVHESELFDAERNIDAGVRHLKALLARYGGNTVLALAAYNAGERSVATHGARIPPFRETMLYVPSVLATSSPPAAGATP